VAGLADDAPTFVRLEVTPAEIVFDKEGEAISLKAEALWSDGTREESACRSIS